MARSLRIVSLAAAAGLAGALLSPAATYAATGYDPRSATTWTHAQLAAQLTFSCATMTNATAIRRHAAAGLGGVMLLGSGTAPGLAASLSAARQAAPAGVAPFIASDEEGGRVQRLSQVIYPLPSPATMGTWPSIKITLAADAYAHRLRDLGVTMVFGPVADIGVPGWYIDRSGRAFGSDAASVTRGVRAFDTGLRAGGVTPVLKHWPGHGQATDSHIAAAVVPALSTLARRDLLPFDAMFAKGAGVVMVAHVTSAGLTEPGVPASASPRALAYLRAGAGRDAVVITDSLVMAAASRARGISPEAAAVASLRAGADWALTCAADPMPTVTAIRKALDSGGYPRTRAVASVQRILALKARVGLVQPISLTARAGATTVKAGSGVRFSGRADGLPAGTQVVGTLVSRAVPVTVRWPASTSPADAAPAP